MVASNAPKLTDELTARAIELLEGGLYRVTVAKLVGVSEVTFSKWMNINRAPYIEFQKRVHEAEAEAERRQLAKIIDSPEPADAKWWMARKFPDRWAETRRVDLSGRVDIGHKINPDQLKKPEARSALITLLGALDAEGDLGPQPADADGDQ